MEPGTVVANGIEFAYLEEGEGPLVLLLHGFPDDAHTWSEQLPGLAEAGYRAVAPFMRGYPPTGAAPDGRYDVEALAADVAGLIDALGARPALVVGHDWGGIAAHAAMSLHPDAVDRAVAVAVGHPATFTDLALTPSFAHHAFHTWLFCTGRLGVAAAQADDMALIDYLWSHWSPGLDDREHVERVKRETLGRADAIEAAIAYYPALVHLVEERPEVVTKLMGTTSVPTLTIFGADDPARVPPDREREFFSGEYRGEVVAGAGHFVQRERPGEVTRLILDWFGAAGSPAVSSQPKVMAPTRSE